MSNDCEQEPSIIIKGWKKITDKLPTVLLMLALHTEVKAQIKEGKAQIKEVKAQIKEGKNE